MKKIILILLSLIISTTSIYALPEHNQHDKAFAVMEREHLVSAKFAKAVAIQESGWFKSNLYKKKNNPFGISGKKGYRSFKSVDESIDYFGRLMSTKKYKDKTIEQIGKIYCPDDKNWAKSVKKIMSMLV